MFSFVQENRKPMRKYRIQGKEDGQRLGLSEQHEVAYPTPARRRNTGRNIAEENYMEWLRGNYTWEAIDRRLRIIEMQSASGTRNECYTDSEANDMVRRELPWLR